MKKKHSPPSPQVSNGPPLNVALDQATVQRYLGNIKNIDFQTFPNHLCKFGTRVQKLTLGTSLLLVIPYTIQDEYT